MDEAGRWIEEEPLFFNPIIQTRLLSSMSVHACLQRHSIVKLGQLLNKNCWESAETLKEVIGFKCSRLTEKITEEIVNALPSSYRRSIGHETSSEVRNEVDFPEIQVAAVGSEREDEE